MTNARTYDEPRTLFRFCAWWSNTVLWDFWSENRSTPWWQREWWGSLGHVRLHVELHMPWRTP